MELKEIFPPSEIFNPRTFYDGMWSINGVAINKNSDILALNAKIIGGENLYIKFLQKHYFEPLNNLLSTKNIEIFHPIIICGDDTKTGKRKTTFCLQTFLSQLPKSLMGNTEAIFDEFNSKDMTDDEALDFMREKLRNEMKKYIDVEKNGDKSSHCEQVNNQYLIVLKTYPNMSYKVFLEKSVQGARTILLGLRYCKELFDKPVNADALVECFDYDKFCLSIAKTNLDECLKVERQYGQIDNIAHYLYFYKSAIEAIKRDNPQYRCVIKYPALNGKIVQYNSDELIKDYNALLVRHPEYSINYINLNTVGEMLQKLGFNDEFIKNFDHSTAEGRKILEMLVRVNKGEEKFTNFVIIPKGKKFSLSIDLGVNAEESSNRNSQYSHKELSEDEANSKMLEARNYLYNSGWLYHIYGINEFEGYEGFIYANGMVIFEKFYENVKNKKVAKNSSTYIMNIYNFIVLSKLSKTEIIYLMTMNMIEGVYRLYHLKDMERWKANINPYISEGYNSEVTEYINSLINQGILIEKNEGGRKNGFN